MSTRILYTDDVLASPTKLMSRLIRNPVVLATGRPPSARDPPLIVAQSQTSLFNQCACYSLLLDANSKRGEWLTC